MEINDLKQLIKNYGATNIGVVNVCDIDFIPAFREACASNACGMYGKCWTCPPYVGEINELIAKAKQYDIAVVYQTIHEIEDSYDIEGMLDAGVVHNKLTHKLNDDITQTIDRSTFLHLSAGGCKLCKTCAKRDDLPCRFPEKAMASLESYGVAVSTLAEKSGLKYINGQNTVTYFGAVFLKQNKDFRVTIIDGEETRVVTACEPTLLSDLLDIHDIHMDYPCAKKGICKKCLVKASGALNAPTKEEMPIGKKLTQGYRLACCAEALGDCTIEILCSSSKLQTAENEINADNLDIKPLFKNYGIAVDIGTTTLAVSLISSENEVLHKSLKNPQIEFGADVISRIERAMDGDKEDLATAVKSGINSLVFDLCKMAKIQPNEIDFAVITGNTVMLHLLTQNDCEPLSHSPFKAEFLGGMEYSASDFGFDLDEKCKIYLPNCFSAFVGADITTAIIASDMMNSEKTSILVDIGTNGEMALWHKGKLCCCSTAAGPAFEGVGVKCGMHGINGAIDHVDVENGEFIVSTIGNEDAKGICGSGVVDCISAMLETEVLDETGRIDDECETYEDRIVDTDDDTMFVFSNGIGIYGKDIRAIQLAKSAICSGIVTLIEESGLTFDDIETLYVAGGFGSFLDINKAGNIGLIPKELVSKVKVIGNAALTGSEMILLNANLKDTAKKMTTEFDLIDLASSPVFMDNYIENMCFDI